MSKKLKEEILDFIKRRDLKIPLMYSDNEEVTCYIRFYIPNTKNCDIEIINPFFD